jgi:hypothetical protein
MNKSNFWLSVKENRELLLIVFAHLMISTVGITAIAQFINYPKRFIIFHLLLVTGLILLTKLTMGLLMQLR